jgi:hypothetical protein
MKEKVNNQVLFDKVHILQLHHLIAFWPFKAGHHGKEEIQRNKIGGWCGA